MRYFTVILLVFGLFISAQTTAQTVSQKGSLFVDVTIPTNEQNRAFSRTMEGMFNGAIGYQYNVFKGLTIGAGAKYSFFVNNRIEFGGTMGGGGTHIPGGFLKIGYEKFTTDRISLYAGIKGGYANIMVYNDSCAAKLNGPFQKPTFFLEPQLEVNILTEIGAPSAFNMIVSYGWNFQEFTSDFICRSSFPGFIEEFSEGYIRYLSIGFGYKHYFGGR
ncbi:MAG: hypothetical protein R3279_08085 [Putridiphycobacter sp.]|nr:hypothetical protein [Putridiphycobacter sp.]